MFYLGRDAEKEVEEDWRFVIIPEHGLRKHRGNRLEKKSSRNMKDGERRKCKLYRKDDNQRQRAR